MNTTTQTPSLVSAIGFLVNHKLPELDTNKTWRYSVEYGKKYAKVISAYKAPAKHARGNLLEGTAEYDLYGPAYLNNPRSSW